MHTVIRLTLYSSKNLPENDFIQILPYLNLISKTCFERKDKQQKNNASWLDNNNIPTEVQGERNKTQWNS